MLGKSNIDVITLFFEDLQAAITFYLDVFGLEQVYEDKNSAVFNFGNMSVNLLQISEAHGLIAPAAVAAREAGSRFQFTIRVEDTEALCRDLEARGVTLLNGPLDRPWGVRTACFADPGGHVWEIAQPLSS
ncbi:VOC family protein [Paenibacillus soyae]|uniref:VOC family protein n=1 Tax=Paenibacillus soyae TaxID=2969249 RepID=A0A9X2MV34_9BACL|nr:VOC family protein [Paenibacillus soyae]MCR2807085.1 VOC family protein [Paenibacillus soyae]